MELLVECQRAIIERFVSGVLVSLSDIKTDSILEASVLNELGVDNILDIIGDTKVQEWQEKRFAGANVKPFNYYRESKSEKDCLACVSVLDGQCTQLNRNVTGGNICNLFIDGQSYGQLTTAIGLLDEKRIKALKL